MVPEAEVGIGRCQIASSTPTEARGNVGKERRGRGGGGGRTLRGKLLAALWTSVRGCMCVCVGGHVRGDGDTPRGV